jgi:hypothetical protein
MRLPICGVIVAIVVVTFVASPHAARPTSQPRYYFTTEPLQIKEFRQCVAVEPAHRAAHRIPPQPLEMG